MKPDRIEVRRKLLHIAVGVAAAAMVWFEVPPFPYAMALFIALTVWAVYALRRRASWVMRVADLFERNHTHPGKGAVTFAIGGILALLLYPRDIGVGALLILTFGDAVTGLAGPYGRVKTILSPVKYIEGTLAGMLAAFLAAALVLPPAEAAVGAAAGMLVEAPEIRVNGNKMPDNVSIPLVAGLAVLLFRLLSA